MARFQLAHQASHGHGAPQPQIRNPLALFQRGFERRFEATRAFYRRLLISALAGRHLFIAGFMVAVLASFGLAPYLGRNFFPPIESTQIALHVRAFRSMRLGGSSARRPAMPIRPRRPLSRLATHGFGWRPTPRRSLRLGRTLACPLLMRPASSWSRRSEPCAHPA